MAEDIGHIQDEVERFLRKGSIGELRVIAQALQVADWHEKTKPGILRAIQEVFDELTEEDQKLTLLKSLPVEVHRQEKYG